MKMFYSILIDLGILGFFGLIYYWFAKRRIIKSSIMEIKQRLQEFLYDLHSFLENNKAEKFYSELDNYAKDLEIAANTDDLETIKNCLERRPDSFPVEFKESLKSIRELI